MYTFSIIIPHKNIPKLLERCLTSIPQREDIEIIIVDDNSDPNIVDFSHFPGINRPNTTVIFDKSGKGAGRARNIGLQHAQGKWILFADADDCFTYCFSDILNQYATDDADVIYFNASSIDSDYYTNSDRANHVNGYINKYLSSTNKEEGAYDLRYIHGAPWGKMIKMKMILLNNISFQETKIHNDTRFSYLIGYYSKKIKADKHAIYCLTYRSDSISYTLTEDKIIDRMKVFADRYRFFEDKGINHSMDSFWINDLLRIKQDNNAELFEDCLAIFERCGIGRKKIELMIKEKETPINGKRQKVCQYLSKLVNMSIK